MQSIGQILTGLKPDIKTQDMPRTTRTWNPEPLRCSPDDQSGNTIPAEWHRVDARLQAAIKTAYESGRWPWYIHGVAGGGKTCAAAFVYRTFPTDKNQWGEPLNFFWDCGKACRSLVCARANYEEWQEKRKIQCASIIVLDDVATREPTGPQLDALLSIINWRAGSPLIATGNASPAELADYVHDDRVVSRLCAGVIIEVTGRDKRLQTALNIKV